MRKSKIGNPTGVTGWRELETAGDCKRLLAWLLHSIRCQTIEPKTAAIMAQIGSYLVKTIEVTEVQERLKQLEKQIASQNEALEHVETQAANLTYPRH